MFEQSPTIAALAAAMADVQGKLEKAAKDKANPAFRSRYADLAACWDTWQEVGPAAGLSIVQFPGQFADGKMTLTSQLSHKSGEWMRCTLSIPVGKQDAQGFGSALTYARRYALCAIAGIAPEDDDGNAASAKPARRNAAADLNPASDEPGGSEDVAEKAREWVDAQIKELDAIAKSNEPGRLKLWHDKNSAAVRRLKNNHEAQYDRLISMYDEVYAMIVPSQTAISAG